MNDGLEDSVIRMINFECGPRAQAYKRRGEKYRLFWPERGEFVRMAAKFGATIIPFAGFGSEDGVSILADSEDISQIPVVGENIIRRANQNIPQARR